MLLGFERKLVSIRNIMLRIFLESESQFYIFFTFLNFKAQKKPIID